MTCKYCGGDGGWWRNDGHDGSEWFCCPRGCNSREWKDKCATTAPKKTAPEPTNVINLNEWKLAHGR